MSEHEHDCAAAAVARRDLLLQQRQACADMLLHAQREGIPSPVVVVGDLRDPFTRDLVLAYGYAEEQIRAHERAIGASAVPTIVAALPGEELRDQLAPAHPMAASLLGDMIAARIPAALAIGDGGVTLLQLATLATLRP